MEKNRRHSWSASVMDQSWTETGVEVPKPSKHMTPGRARRWAARTALRLLREAPNQWRSACAVVRSCKPRGGIVASMIAYDDGPDAGVYLTGNRLGVIVQPRRLSSR